MNIKKKIMFKINKSENGGYLHNDRYDKAADVDNCRYLLPSIRRVQLSSYSKLNVSVCNMLI